MSKRTRAESVQDTSTNDSKHPLKPESTMSDDEGKPPSPKTVFIPKLHIAKDIEGEEMRKRWITWLESTSMSEEMIQTIVTKLYPTGFYVRFYSPALLNNQNVHYSRPLVKTYGNVSHIPTSYLAQLETIIPKTLFNQETKTSGFALTSIDPVVGFQCAHTTPCKFSRLFDDIMTSLAPSLSECPYFQCQIPCGNQADVTRHLQNCRYKAGLERLPAYQLVRVCPFTTSHHIPIHNLTLHSMFCNHNPEIVKMSHMGHPCPVHLERAFVIGRIKKIESIVGEGMPRWKKIIPKSPYEHLVSKYNIVGHDRELLQQEFKPVLKNLSKWKENTEGYWVDTSIVPDSAFQNLA